MGLNSYYYGGLQPKMFVGMIKLHECISWHELFLAGNQGSYQNLVSSMLTYKFWLIFMWMKQKKIKLADSKRLSFSTLPILNIFSGKISGIGTWVSRISWCKGHQCYSTYMVISSTSHQAVWHRAKKCIFCVFSWRILLKRLWFELSKYSGFDWRHFSPQGRNWQI